MKALNIGLLICLLFFLSDSINAGTVKRPGLSRRFLAAAQLNDSKQFTASSFSSIDDQDDIDLLDDDDFDTSVKSLAFIGSLFLFSFLFDRTIRQHSSIPGRQGNFLRVINSPSFLQVFRF
jgi:hypothetical protein